VEVGEEDVEAPRLVVEMQAEVADAAAGVEASNEPSERVTPTQEVLPP